VSFFGKARSPRGVDEPAEAATCCSSRSTAGKTKGRQVLAARNAGSHPRHASPRHGVEPFNTFQKCTPQATSAGAEVHAAHGTLRCHLFWSPVAATTTRGGRSAPTGPFTGGVATRGLAPQMRFPKSLHFESARQAYAPMPPRAAPGSAWQRENFRGTPPALSALSVRQVCARRTGRPRAAWSRGPPRPLTWRRLMQAAGRVRHDVCVPCPPHSMHRPQRPQAVLAGQSGALNGSTPRRVTLPARPAWPGTLP
jgi:hypothetical protein